MKKEVTKTDKNEEEVTEKESYILQFIDSARSLTNLVINLSEGAS